MVICKGGFVSIFVIIMSIWFWLGELISEKFIEWCSYVLSPPPLSVVLSLCMVVKSIIHYVWCLKFWV